MEVVECPEEELETFEQEDKNGREGGRNEGVKE
jgi:hypothetical protein